MGGTRLSCPKCGTSLRLSEAASTGQRVRCPRCAQIFAPAVDAMEEAIVSDLKDSRAAVADDDYARRRHARAADADGARRPRKRKKERGNRALLIGLLAGGAGLVLILVIVLILVLNQGGRDAGPGNLPGAGAARPGPFNQPAAFAGRHEHTSAEGKYRVIFPRAPVEQRRNVAGAEMRTYLVEEPTGAYLVAFADMPFPPNEPAFQVQNRLVGAQQGFLTNVRGRATSQSAITLNGKYPGRQFEGEVAGPRAGRVRGKIFLVGNRLYQIVVMGEVAFVAAREADTFLNSFTYLE